VEFESADVAETAICKFIVLKISLQLVLLTCHAAKFFGYQYGGRPLGITFVKYAHPSGPEDAMDATETPGGLTQDQIM
jgi:hypothetical protein